MHSMIQELDGWVLETSETERQQAWERSAAQGSGSARWTAYLNRIAIESFKTLIKKEYGQQFSLWPIPQLQCAIWEWVTGTAITIGQHRLIIIPTETVDASELAVPQEWIDIPNWVGDYYVSVQIYPGEEHLQILGYTTHKKIKEQGEYDAFERQYSLSREDLLHWDHFGLTYSLYPAEETRAAVAPLISLSNQRVNQLIKRLGKPKLLIPRLEIPFQQWGVLLTNQKWRQQLYKSRCDSTPTITELSAWLKGEISPIWQSLKAVVKGPQEFVTERRGNQSISVEEDQESILFRTQPLVLSVDCVVLLSIGIKQLGDSTCRVKLNLESVKSNSTVPSEITVLVSNELGKELVRTSATQTEIVKIQLRLKSNDNFTLEVSSGDYHHQEVFETLELP